MAVTSTSPLYGSSSITVESFANYLAPDIWAEEELLKWPPDVFAVVAALLLKSGAYSHAVSRWKRTSPLTTWVNQIRESAREWRQDPNVPPANVVEWHQQIVSKRTTPIFEICKDHELCSTLLQLFAVADEACSGAGCTLPNPVMNDFLQQASKRLAETSLIYRVSTLCKHVHHTTVRVLPKLHTPQSGITIRSLSHNLSLCPAGDVNVNWSECLSVKRHCLNLLLAPWPLVVTPSHFQSVDPSRAELPDIAKGFGFFEYNPPPDEKAGSALRRFFQGEEDTRLFTRLKDLLANARRAVHRIDGVVFPELALTSGQYGSISEYLMEEGIFLICGVRQSPVSDGEAAQNYLQFDIPFPRQPAKHRQDKHHRWRLDKRQIVQYGVGSALDVASNWWEHISIGERELYFVVLDDWLTVCPLICEDLARQDPIAELVRAVGPNLVIALLMDGPQLPSRWPARYATVLADDPGSSVLTLTSLGMAELSMPPPGGTRSRAIALWKDAKTGEAISIEMPPKMEGVILSLSRQYVEEWSADGRGDCGTTGFPTLSGIHFVGTAPNT